MNELKEKNIMNLFIHLTLPSFVIVLVSGSYSIIDGIFLGQTLGVEGNAANSYVFLLYAAINSVSAWIAQGVSSIITLWMGQGKKDDTEKLIGTSIWLSIVVAIGVSGIITILFEEILSVLNISNSYYNYIEDYFKIFMICTPIYFIAHTLLYCMRAEGIVFKVLVINVIAFVVNLLSSFVFVKILNWGFTGSALSTILANICICILSFRHFKYDYLNLNKKYICFNLYGCFNILSTGLPVFISRFCSVALLLLYNYIANHYSGEIGIAALSIVTTIYRYIITLTDSIVSGIQPIIGYNYGANKLDRVNKTLGLAIFGGSVFSILVFWIIRVYSVKIILLFNPENILLKDFASEALKSVLLMIWTQGFSSIGTYYFQFIGNKKKSTLLVIIRQIILQVPLAFILSSFYGINGLWKSFWIADFILFIIVFGCLGIEVRKNINKSLEDL